MAKYNAQGWLPEPESPKHWMLESSPFQDRISLYPLPAGDTTLRPFSGERHNQGVTSSCVANATIKALEIRRVLTRGRDAHVDLSRLAVYYLARELMLPSETRHDKGTFISHAFDALRRFGVPPEEAWPFNPANVNSAPSFSAMRLAYQHKIKDFYKIGATGTARVDQVVECLAAGYPVVFGTSTGANWYSYKKGDVLTEPEVGDGRHATVLIGVENGKFIGENSWGSGWGDDGFYLMDPKVIASDCSKDFWVARGAWEPSR